VRIQGEKEHLYTVGKNVRSMQLLESEYRVYSKKLKIELSYDPVIPLLVLYTRRCKSVYDTHMLIATFFTIVRQQSPLDAYLHMN
jgi:hypothetical protein